MAGKDNLSKLLGGEQPKPAIRRGQGVRLSTEVPTPEAIEEQRIAAETQEHINAETHERKNAKMQNDKPKRINRGYQLREDLIKACKRIALEEDRNLYEVMEEALEQYLATRRNPA